MFHLVRYFSITSLIAFVSVTVVLAVFYRQTAINDLIALRESNNVALTQMFANSLWSEFHDFVSEAGEIDPEALRDHPDIARLREAVLAHMAGLTVVKVKVYDLNALTVFSTEAAQIGEDKSGNAGYLAAREGQVATELTHRDTFSAFEQMISDRDVISSYVPIQRSGGEIEGVFEIYDDVTILLDRLEATQFNILMGVVMILTMLYGALFLIVQRGDNIIQEQALERERVETARRASEERLRTIVNSTPIILWVIDRDQKITLVEGRSLPTSGTQGESVIGKPVGDVYGPRVARDMARALQGTEHAAVIQLDEFSFDARYTPLRNEQGTVVGVIGVATDITERMMAEGALGDVNRDLESRNQELERVQEFMTTTLDTMTETVKRGTTPTEILDYLKQVKTQFTRLD
jgi:PAS domain S-box-containing protein